MAVPIWVAVVAAQCVSFQAVPSLCAAVAALSLLGGHAYALSAPTPSEIDPLFAASAPTPSVLLPCEALLHKELDAAWVAADEGFVAHVEKQCGFRLEHSETSTQHTVSFIRLAKSGSPDSLQAAAEIHSSQLPSTSGAMDDGLNQAATEPEKFTGTSLQATSPADSAASGESRTPSKARLTIVDYSHGEPKHAEL